MQTVRAFEKRFGIPLLVGMGMTEAGGIFLNPLSHRKRNPKSVGHAHGFEVRIVDDQGAAVSPGEVGHLWLRGGSLMTGYYNDPKATAAAIDAEGWLHSGDLGHLDEDGFFYLVGRSKNIVIKGGVNISPHEVEAFLLRQPTVRETAVIGVPDHILGEELVAWVVAEDGLTPSAGKLLAASTEALGQTRTPGRIEIVDALPRGDLGKVVRGELVRHAIDGCLPPPENLPPPEEVHALLTWDFQDLLDGEKVSLEDDFFEHGGSSLAGLKLLQRIDQRWGVRLPLKVLFEEPTVKGLTDYLLSNSCTPKTRASVLLAPVSKDCSAWPLFCVYGPNRYAGSHKGWPHAGPHTECFPSGKRPCWIPISYVAGRWPISFNPIWMSCERFGCKARIVWRDSPSAA